jgi:putative acetyltransferase
MEIREDDLTGPQIIALLREHLENMHEITPPGSVHALDLEKLRAPNITFWTAWEVDDLLGCGALKELDPTSGEIKSMRPLLPIAARASPLAFWSTLLMSLGNGATPISI